MLLPPPAAWLLMTLTLHAATVRPSYQQDQCVLSNAANLSLATEPSKCTTSDWLFGGTYVDMERPMQCRGNLLAWKYCSNEASNKTSYLTVWRRNATLPDVLDRVYFQELNDSTIPTCPGVVTPSESFVVETGDYLGVIQPYDQTVPLVCSCNRMLQFVQMIYANDTAAQVEARALSAGQLMNDSLCFVNITPVIELLPASTHPSPVTSSHPPPDVPSDGVGVAITVSIVCFIIVVAAVSVVVVLCIVLNRKKLHCLDKKGKAIGIGNTLYMLTDVDGGRVCSGPIYEDPTITTGGKTKPPEPDYEVDPNLRNGTNWAQAYDVVTMALPASHGKEPSHLSIEGQEQEYRYSRILPPEGTEGGEVPGEPTSSQSPSVHHYHILEQVVKGEYTYQDVSPFREPPDHVSELCAEMSKFSITRIPRDEITIVGPLGSGHFSVVSRGIWKGPSGQARDVAVKSLACTDQLSKVKFLQEAVIMGQFKHPNVVQLCGSVTEGDAISLVIEYLPNGDLSKYLQQMRTKPGGLAASPSAPMMLLEYCQQVAFGMHYLATKGFIHRDLAARNILVSQHGVCKIADFGLSRDLASEDYYVSKGGAIPIKWTAPEAIHYKKYSTASDVWSYGCLLYEIWSVGHKPFEDLSNIEVIQKVSAGDRPSPPPGCPHPIYKLMISCWHPDTTLRPQFGEILAVLIGHNVTVLSIPDDIVSAGTQATVLGAPLEAGFTLYMDLQAVYKVPMT